MLFTRRAEIDLEDIGDYIAKDNPGRAATFVDEILEHCRKLIMFPQASRLRPELGEGVRVSSFGRYLILYVVHADLLEIRRIVHGARNLLDMV